MDGWTDRHTYIDRETSKPRFVCFCEYVNFYLQFRSRNIDRHTDRPTDTQTGCRLVEIT